MGMNEGFKKMLEGMKKVDEGRDEVMAGLEESWLDGKDLHSEIADLKISVKQLQDLVLNQSKEIRELKKSS